MKQNPLDYLQDELTTLEAAGLRRPTVSPQAAEPRSFCSNDYLGMATRPSPPVSTGAGASRLLAGERPEHRRLEHAFAGWLGLEDALAFTSGYAANVGAIAALARPGDLLVSDELNHASIIDGARLSRAQTVIVPHNDLGAIRQALARRPPEGRALVLVESYYSMDADGPDLGGLREVCDAHGAALLVDEAHALGVLGPAGCGRCAEAGIIPDVLVGTLGKAFGAQGAFVAGRSVLREWLWNRARSFVFSTGLAPASAAAALLALEHLAEHPELREQVIERALRLRSGLSELCSPEHGVSLRGFGHVVPIVLGTEARALRLAAELAARGVDARAVRPPTVPPGTSRVRFTVSARHSNDDIDRAVHAVREALPSLVGLPQ